MAIRLHADFGGAGVKAEVFQSGQGLAHGRKTPKDYPNIHARILLLLEQCIQEPFIDIAVLAALLGIQRLILEIKTFARVLNERQHVLGVIVRRQQGLYPNLTRNHQRRLIFRGDPRFFIGRPEICLGYPEFRLRRR